MMDLAGLTQRRGLGTRIGVPPELDSYTRQKP